MAELSRFFGIIIRMFAEHGGKHHTPYFHAVYQEHEAVQMLSGFLPIKQQRMVEAWAEIHQDELLAAWQSLDSGKKPQSIKPLR